MRQLLPFEEIIAKKLEQLPVPDLQDAIWNSIQSNLNSPLPDVVNDGVNLDKGVTVSTAKIVIGFIISVAIITITVAVVSRKKKSKQDMKQLPQIMQPKAPGNDSFMHEELRRKKRTPYPKTDTGVTVSVPGSVDTSIKISPVFPLIINPDSNRLISPILLGKDSILKPLADSPKKKTIGVTGISDSSYKISGKKDSL